MPGEWFRHDAVSRHDPRILRLRAKYGPAGYGVFWMLAETMYQLGGQIRVEDIPVYALEVHYDNLAELIADCCSWGLLHGDDDVVWSDRTRRELMRRQSTSDARAAAGKLGGEASGEARRSKIEANASGGRSKAEANASENEAKRSTDRQTEKTYRQDGRKSKTPSSADADGWADWWAEYPRKVAKIDAEKAYRSALKRTDAATLLAGLRRWRPSVANRPPDKIPHAATWLNGGRWTDEPEAPPTPATNGTHTKPRGLDPDAWPWHKECLDRACAWKSYGPTSAEVCPKCGEHLRQIMHKPGSNEPVDDVDADLPATDDATPEVEEVW